MSFVLRERAQRWMQRAGLDAVVLAKPENFQWATGAFGGVAGYFRRAGAALAVVPADAQRPIGAVTTPLFAAAVRQRLGPAQVLTHDDWIESADIRPWLDEPASAAELTRRAFAASGRSPGFSRPAAFDARASFAALGRLLNEAGLGRARIGLDLDFWPALDVACLQQVLPRVTWVDASATIGWIRVVKASGEIARLRQAAALAEHGMHAAVGVVAPGVSREAIAAVWIEAVEAEARRQGARLTGRWEYTSVGPLPWASSGVSAAPGHVIKFDVGCLVDGYSSDCGRTFSLGPARPRAREVMRALEEAFVAGLEVLKPGRAFREVHEQATKALHRAGFEGFARGHFGHSLGVDTFCEVPPFIAAQAEEPIETGMVLAFETPFYLDGEGGFIIEDQFLITDDGAEPAWSLPRGLVELPL